MKRWSVVFGALMALVLASSPRLVLAQESPILNVNAGTEAMASVNVNGTTNQTLNDNGNYSFGQQATGNVAGGSISTHDGAENNIGEALTNLGDVSASIGDGVNVGSVGGAMNPGGIGGVNVSNTNGINLVTTNTGVANTANSIAINAKVQF